MARTRAIRITVIAVCVGGIAGMIVTSALNHNGAAITFGLITAVAVLCQMAVTTALNEAAGAPGAPLAGERPAGPNDPEEDAAELEAHIQDLVKRGADEAGVRDLVRRAVRLGRRRPAAAPPDS
ncbi:MAG TPA: hypothetical protein VGI06_15765 [Acidimicrobiales bacterium]